MCILMNCELEMLEIYILFFGIVGLISLYIGLFGIVWGIMYVFIVFGVVKQVILQMVVSGIVEVLIVIVIGLFVVILVVMVYNCLNQCVNKFELNYDNFMEEFIVILYCQVFIISESNKG